MTVPHIPIEVIDLMPRGTFSIYLELCIKWHEDIRDGAIHDYDRVTKQLQIDLLQEMVDEIDGIMKPSFIERMIALICEDGE